MSVSEAASLDREADNLDCKVHARKGVSRRTLNSVRPSDSIPDIISRRGVTLLRMLLRSRGTARPASCGPVYP